MKILKRAPLWAKIVVPLLIAVELICYILYTNKTINVQSFIGIGTICSLIIAVIVLIVVYVIHQKNQNEKS
jgi:uncharacterized membrane protein YukC